MNPMDCFRLIVLCLWLLDTDVNCENTQKGYVPPVQAGQTQMGFHNDNRDHKRWSEPPIFRLPATGYKTPSVDRGTSGNIYLAQQDQDHTADSESSQILSRYPLIPDTQYKNVPKSQVNHFKSGFSSAPVTQGRSAVVYTRSGNKAFAFPDGKKIHQANSGSVIPTGVVQVSPRIYRTRAKMRGYSPLQVNNAPVGIGPNDRKALMYSHSSAQHPDIQAINSSLKSDSHKIHMNPSRHIIRPLNPQELRLTTRNEGRGYHPAYVFPKSFNHDRTNVLQKALKPIDKKAIVKGQSPGTNSERKVDRQMSYPPWRSRFYSSDVMPQARGYAHVHHLKPGFDKTRLQASSAADGKFLDVSPKPGFGLGVPASSEGQLNLNYNSRRTQPGRWHPLPPDRAPIPVQGKFKPFQRLPTSDDPPVHPSVNETTPTQVSSGTTLPPSLNSTHITSSVVPSVSGELSTKSASLMQTEGPGCRNCTSSIKGQSGSSAEVGPSLERHKPFTVFPLKLQSAEKEGEGVRVVSSPL